MKSHTKRQVLIGLALLILVPTAGRGDSLESAYNWTIGYERYNYYGSGPLLRRFLGNGWEVFLAGGPDDWRTTSDGNSWETNYRVDEPLEHYFVESDDSDKREAGWVMLGGGRRLFREDGFWLVGFLGLEYSWSNYQDVDSRETYPESDEPLDWSLRVNDNERVGHYHELAVILGLRPSYDLTSRISLALYLGLAFSRRSETWDNHRISTYYDPDGVILRKSTFHERQSYERDEATTFGLNGTSNISFFFRF